MGFFNATACRAIQNVFFDTRTTPAKLRPEPRWDLATLDDGAVIFKLLFTTADFDALQGALTWKAHVSEPHDTTRALREVRHMQMDIAVKDRRLQGLFQDDDGVVVADGWVMLTYYYDVGYTTPLQMPLPEGLRHLRPMGIQSGFGDSGRGESIIFAGAETNQDPGVRMLNGPADNPKSSCLGCHATAGIPGNVIPMAPGVMSTKRWRELKREHKATMLDFGQQFALAKRNFETPSPR